MPTRIEKLASNQTMYYRGDTCLEISPFTNYYMFTIYRESNDAKVDDHVPLNLTNLGTIWLSFISGETRVRVPHYTDAENVDMANGEVVFRIPEEDAARILALSAHTFYVSSAISGNGTSSDETVLFSGTWAEFSSAMRTSLTETIQSLNETIAKLENKIMTDTDAWNVRLSELETENGNLKGEIDRLKAQIADLENQLAESGVEYIDATIISDSSDGSGRKLPVETTQTNERRDLELNAAKLSVSTLRSAFGNDVKAKIAARNSSNQSSGSDQSSGSGVVNTGVKRR